MPNVKKPVGTQQDRRPQRQGLALVADGGETERDIPTPPPNLLPENVDLWNGYWTSPVAAAALDIDLAVVERWILARDEWCQSINVMRQARIVDGSMGQPVLNPLSSWIASREATMQKCEAELGLTPMARNKLGIAVGQARLTAAELNRKTLELANGDDDRNEVIEATTVEPEDDSEWEAG